LCFSHQFAFALLWTVLALPANSARAAAPDWKPVDPADLALTAPRVEKDADAEAIFWEVWVTDEIGLRPRSIFTHYIRMKIFTDRGRDQHSTVDLPFGVYTNVTDIAGRTIKPDGAIVELKKDAVFERILLKAGGLKVKAKSFAMPAVEPGAIIEYRWREDRKDQLANYVRLPFQRDVPVRMVRYHFKPLADPLLVMRTRAFHFHPTAFVSEPNGFYSTSAVNVPAFVEEPQMPPENEVLAWMLVYYSENRNPRPEQYWSDYSRQNYEAFKPAMKVNGNVRSIAGSIVSGDTDDEVKLRHLFDYCRTRIKNVRNDAVTAEERADTTRNKNPADTLKQGAGTGFDIDMAFAALATAAGFDARIARLGDRSDSFFDPGFPDSYFLRAYDVAVNVQGGWRFFDPATTYVPFGMLRWQEEGERALIADPKGAVFVPTPLSPPEKSMSKRQGRFVLAEDGTLEGDVRLEYTGHEAAARKKAIEGDSQEQRAANIREMVKNRMNTAEITDIRVENATDPEKPVIYQYHVKAPGYAQRTGKRLFLQLAFFQFNAPALFPTATRKYPVYFDYPWSEDDDVEVQMPPGFELDHADAPAPLGFGRAGKYEVKISVGKASRKLHYTRKLTFGNGGVILIPVEEYAPLKQIFDRIHEADNHALTLKQEAAAAK